ncbi:MAG: class I SAM-dependent methyltransferase [Chloroflexi bacterium]|nr:class I SAM-dependent methyltransferase [Chloroflexota bacterium]
MELAHLSDIERWLLDHASPERLDSASALYELMPRQRGGQLPFVDVPYDARREEHWADAARVADYVAHAPEDACRVLDVGPGDGWPALPIAAARPDLEVVGVDPAAQRTRVCAVNAGRLGIANASFVTGDAGALPFADASFDLATAASALEEADDPEAVFAELHRVLRNGGVLRASYQDWRLAAPEIETVLLWDGVARQETPEATSLLLYTYVHRLQEPAVERRWTLELPAEGEAREVHQQALVASASGRRAYGETLLTPSTAADLGVPLLERLAPLARRCTVVEMRRWTTEWLVGALGAAGFPEVHSTAHPGDIARHVGRELIARGDVDAVAPHFEALTTAIGVAAGRRPGRDMVVARR